MRALFLGSPPFALPVLARLLDSRHRVVGLVTQPAKPRGRGRKVAASALVELATARGVEVLELPDPHLEQALARMRALEPEVLLVASYGVILKPPLLELAPHGALNVHASLLPRHRGASPIQAAILAGDATTGVTIQRIVPRLDEGDVLLARELAVPAEANSGELLQALAELGGEAAVEALDRLEDGTATFTPQDHGQATYARKLGKRSGRIDWTWSAGEIARHVRAMTPWPGARFRDPRGRELTLLRARSVDAAALRGDPGEVLETSRRFVVATGVGALELLEVCPAGKRPMGGEEFLRGARLQVGEVLRPGAD